MLDKEYGSGHFGSWITDEFGCPAYEYTCDQITDEKACTPMNEMWRSNRDHYFLVGNDRIVAIASNFGYMKVRQDEGSPKYLNYYEPELQQYAGGFGYLKDHSSELTTYYLGKDQKLKRLYGIGYFKKEVADERYHVKQVIFAPYGDDPILISQVTITNKTQENVAVSWYEYWGCFNFQFSFQAILEALGKKDVNLLKDYRINFEKSFKNKVSIINGQKGLFNIKYDEKSSMKDVQLDYQLRSTGTPIRNERASLNDKYPPPIFLISLDEPSNGFFNDSRTFFGVGRVENPVGLVKESKFDINVDDYHNCLILERKLNLSPNQSKMITFAYGYIPKGFDLNALIKKYSKNPTILLTSSIDKWKERQIRFEVNGKPWIDREMIWHSYYLQGLSSFDSYFGEHILSQGHVYQYIIGFQGAARDPLQHAFPFLYNNPCFAKEILRYTLKEVQEDGKIPYGITGNGMFMPSPWDPSDLELWVLWLFSEYILSSRDLGFLDEVIKTYPVHGKRAKESTIKDLIYLVLKHFIKVTGQGKHGLIRVGSCDWNDMVITGFVPNKKQAEVKKNGESCLNTAMAIYIFSRFIEMLSVADPNYKIQEITMFRESLIKSMRKQWNGKWFKRAWLSEELGWIGDHILWLEPQPWAIISKVADENQRQELIRNINKLLRDPSPIGAILLSEPVEKHSSESKGMATNGGIWPSINGTLVWALTHVNGNWAYEEWRKNLLSYKTEVYPDIWYGIWSGPDTWNSIHSDYPGHTIFDKYYMTKKEEDRGQGTFIGVNWTDFPVLNLHPHAWPLFNIFHLIGTRFTKEGIEFTPVIPEKSYKIQSSILYFEKHPDFYAGYYFPQAEGLYKITHFFKSDILKNVREVIVNDQKNDFKITKNSLIFHGTGGGNHKLIWKIILIN
jgi:hypothetical protein